MNGRIDEHRHRFRVTPRGVAALMIGMFFWGLVAAPASVGDEDPVVEPADLAAYSTLADARPVQTYFDHQAYQIPLGPSLAHAQTEVALPSSASGIAWLVDGGLANGLHGTTTGSRVPTEASAKQPGGAAAQEFRVAGGPIGDEAFAEVGAGIAGARADHDDTPRGQAYSHFENLVILPAAGNPENPPGTFNPDNTFPGDENGAPTPDPQPQGQMAILSIGSMASTAESFRNGSVVTSIAVAEPTDIAIGNRTSDNRCTNCIRIDSIRAEAYVEASGQPGGARGRYRVIIGRACRRALDPDTNTEVDQCIRPANAAGELPQDSTKGNPVGPPDETEEIQRFEELNNLFAEPIWTMLPGLEGKAIGIRLHAGTPHEDADRANRTSNPKEDPQRNYAYPDDRLKRECREDSECEHRFEGQEIPPSEQQAPDQDLGTTAKAVAEALDIEITMLTLTQFVPSDAEFDEATMELAEQIDEDDERPGIQITIPECAASVCVPPIGSQIAGQQVQVWPLGQQTIGLDALRTMRRINVTFGVAAATAIARPAPPAFGPGTTPPAPVPPQDQGSDPTFTDVNIPDVGSDVNLPATPAGPPGTVIIRGDLSGPLKIKINWSRFQLKPWKPADQAKGFLGGGIIGGVWVLLRRRLKMLG